jgi:hypothetical protein
MVIHGHPVALRKGYGVLRPGIEVSHGKDANQQTWSPDKGRDGKFCFPDHDSFCLLAAMNAMLMNSGI